MYMAIYVCTCTCYFDIYVYTYADIYSLKLCVCMMTARFVLRIFLLSRSRSHSHSRSREKREEKKRERAVQNRCSLPRRTSGIPCSSKHVNNINECSASCQPALASRERHWQPARASTARQSATHAAQDTHNMRYKAVAKAL